jgi:hypothetical protein
MALMGVVRTAPIISPCRWGYLLHASWNSDDLFDLGEEEFGKFCLLMGGNLYSCSRCWLK